MTVWSAIGYIILWVVSLWLVAIPVMIPIGIASSMCTSENSRISTLGIVIGSISAIAAVSYLGFVGYKIVEILIAVL